MTAKPSQEYDSYWIFERYAGSDTPGYVGKWLLYVPVNELDEKWEAVRGATKNGKLGIEAKASTMRDNPNARSPFKLICVYTKDCRDLDDVRRVLSGLRAMGFTQKIYYKEDAATTAGNYQRGRASLYESPGGSEIRQRRPVTEKS